MKNSITQITGDFIKKIGEIFKESEKLYETEEAYCFLTVRLNLREPITKKASGGYEYLADTTVNSLLAFSKNFSYKNLTRTYPMSDVDFFPILL